MNPFYFYVFSNVFCILFYQLHWSKSFGNLNVEIYTFYFVTSVISLIFGYLINQTNKIEINKLKINNKLIIYLLGILICIQIVFDPNIPLLSVLKYNIDNHLTYGLPILFPLILTITIAYAVIVFNNYLFTKQKKYLLIYALCYLPAVIFFMRGIASIIMISSLVLLIVNVFTTLKIKQLLIILLLFITSSYLFGLAGNARLPLGQNFLLQGNADENFINSIIPKEFFWVYMYIASALGNFVLNTSYLVHDTNYIGFINSEIIPNIITQFYSDERIGVLRVLPTFTVGTLFSRSYNYLGWYGPYFIFIYFIIFNMFWLTLIKIINKKYLTIVNIILCTASFLTIFSNMLVETSIIFPLIITCIFGFLTKYKIKVKN